MPAPYSYELRQKAIASVERGEKKTGERKNGWEIKGREEGKEGEEREEVGKKISLKTILPTLPTLPCLPTLPYLTNQNSVHPKKTIICRIFNISRNTRLFMVKKKKGNWRFWGNQSQIGGQRTKN